MGGADAFGALSPSVILSEPHHVSRTHMAPHATGRHHGLHQQHQHHSHHPTHQQHGHGQADQYDLGRAAPPLQHSPSGSQQSRQAQQLVATPRGQVVQSNLHGDAIPLRVGLAGASTADSAPVLTPSPSTLQLPDSGVALPANGHACTCAGSHSVITGPVLRDAASSTSPACCCHALPAEQSRCTSHDHQPGPSGRSGTRQEHLCTTAGLQAALPSSDAWRSLPPVYVFTSCADHMVGLFSLCVGRSNKQLNPASADVLPCRLQRTIDSALQQPCEHRL